MNILSRKRNKSVAMFLLILSALSLFAASGAIFHHIRYQRKAIFKIKTDQQKLTVKAIKDIDAFVKLAMNEVDTVANNPTNGKIDKSDMLHQISKLILKSPNFYGSAICCRPFGYDPAKD